MSSSTSRPSTRCRSPATTTASRFPTADSLSIASAALLANDSDPDGDPLTITGVDNATNGTVAFNSQTSTVTFTPTVRLYRPGKLLLHHIGRPRRHGVGHRQPDRRTIPTRHSNLFSPSNTPSFFRQRSRLRGTGREVHRFVRRHHHRPALLQERPGYRNAYRLAVDQHRHAARRRQPSPTRARAAGRR